MMVFKHFPAGLRRGNHCAAPFVGRLVALLSLVIILLAFGCGSDEKNPFGVRSEIVTAAAYPIALAFTPDGRLFFGEQETGNIRIVTKDGALLPDPFAHVDVQIGLEWGVTGLAIDPDFGQNRYIYVYYTQAVNPQAPMKEIVARPQVTRFTEEQNKGVDPKVIMGDLPVTDVAHPGYNANGRIGFGLDGFLYISVGDYDSPSFNPQDLSMPQGKLLRVNKDDGSPPPDNPFIGQAGADPRVFAYGFREPFGFAFHPGTGKIYGTDNTPVSCEELNIINSGANYGYPNVGQFPFADCRFGNHTHGIHFFSKKDTQPESFLSNTYISDLAFVSGSKYPTIGDALLVCESELETHDLRRLTLGGESLDQVTADDIVVKDCKLDVAISPDGTIVYSNEKEIRRLVQQETSKGD